MYKILADIDNTDDKVIGKASQMNDAEIDLFSADRSSIFDDVESENDINSKIIDSLRLKNIELNNKIKEINRGHDEEIRNLEEDLERLEKDKEANLPVSNRQYEDKIALLEKQIEDMSIWAAEKRNELKDEAFYEYLSLIKEDYDKMLRDDKGDSEIKAVFTYVAGVKYKNPDGQSRQKIIREYVKDNCDSNLFDKNDYNYVSNEEIERDNSYGYGKNYYQYELEEFDTVTLVREVDNPYDENAIGIIHDEMGHIGHIPRKDTGKVKILLDSNEKLEYRLKFYGGSYKYYDEYQYKVKTSSTTYSFKLSIECV